MQTISRFAFTAVKTEGGLLPPDLLQRIADGRDLDGLKPVDYHLAPSERINEVVSRSWSRCVGVWQAFRKAADELAESDAGTTLTRERWLLILFEELGYGRLSALRSPLETPDGETWSISHLWNDNNNTLPIHLVTFRQDLDKRSEVRTALRKTPHSLMQEYLNRSPRHQWGIISNGCRMRLLHNNVALRRAAYVEFDLAAIFDGELYAEFTLLWLLCHQSRFERQGQGQRAEGQGQSAKGGSSHGSRITSQDDEEEVETPEPDDTSSPCWLDVWQARAAEQGTRALDALRDGVADAIVAFGEGFLRQSANGALRARLQSGELSVNDYYQQVRRLTCRLIFLFVAEDRDLLFVPGTADSVKTHYNDYYALHRLRERAGKMRGTPHVDLYRQVRLLFGLLRTGYAPLGLPGLGSFLFSDKSTSDLDIADLGNDALLTAVRALSYTRQNSVLRAVDYLNLDTEELGSVYESLLELHPQLNVDARTFALTTGAGSERKTTGSHYTPTSLVECLLDSALEPVVADRLKRAGKERPSREAAILDIKVLDYAAGSGHMLIGAGRRLASHLAAIRAGEEEPTPEAWRQAMREVVRHCLYGVDLNEMAVELCKVALWMESMEPGKPLSFLDAHIQVGNSLIGVTPGLDISTIPDDAFTARTGDDKTLASSLRRRNKTEREGQLTLFGEGDEQGDIHAAWRSEKMRALDRAEEESVAHVRAKEESLEKYFRSLGYQEDRLEADLWTSAFFWELPSGDASRFVAPTQGELNRLRGLGLKDGKWVASHAPLLEGMRRHRRAYRYFHWALQFPDVFAPRESNRGRGGFDVLLSNPPWDQMQFRYTEYFVGAKSLPTPVAAGAEKTNDSYNLEDSLENGNRQYERERAASDRERGFAQNSTRFSLTGRGRMNTYALFAELARHLIAPNGRAGIIVPTGIATDDTTKFYFQEVMQSHTLASLYDFENRRAIFPGIHRSYKFSLLTLRGADDPDTRPAEFVFFALDVDHLREPERRFSLTAQEIALLNPNTRTCPIFRSQRDARILKQIYGRFSPLVLEDDPDGNPFGLLTKPGLFNMTGDSKSFVELIEPYASNFDPLTRENATQDVPLLPLVEAKMVGAYDHRAAGVVISKTATLRLGQPASFSTAAHTDPLRYPLPRYWIAAALVEQALRGHWEAKWLIGWKQVTSPTNERTLIPFLSSRVGIGHSLYVALVHPNFGAETEHAVQLVAVLASFVVDYVCRQKLGGINMTPFTLLQLPVRFGMGEQRIGWNASNAYKDFLLPRVLELTYTAWDLQAFACDCGYHGPPFRWDEERRFLLRAELDAAYFHLYGIERDDVDHIMETFPIVKRKDVAAHGEYRTKRVILEIYDEMAEAERTGVPYATRLDPPPADPRVAHKGQ